MKQMATTKQMRPRTLRRDQKADREGGCAGSMLANDWVRASLMHPVGEYRDVSLCRLTTGSDGYLNSLIRGHQPIMEVGGEAITRLGRRRGRLSSSLSSVVILSDITIAHMYRITGVCAEYRVTKLIH